MVLSRTMTAPTNLRGQVERLATVSAMRMKYSSHEARGSFIVDGSVHDIDHAACSHGASLRSRGTRKQAPLCSLIRGRAQETAPGTRPRGSKEPLVLLPGPPSLV